MGLVQFTSREFRSNQASIFDLADKGETVVISRGKKKSYMLTPLVNETYSVELSDETLSAVAEAREEYKRGEVMSCKNKEDLKNLLDSL